MILGGPGVAFIAPACCRRRRARAVSALTAVSFTPRKPTALEFVFRAAGPRHGRPGLRLRRQRTTPRSSTSRSRAHAVTRRWVTMPDAQIDRALLHPGREGKGDVRRAPHPHAVEERTSTPPSSTPPRSTRPTARWWSRCPHGRGRRRVGPGREARCRGRRVDSGGHRGRRLARAGERRCRARAGERRGRRRAGERRGRRRAGGRDPRRRRDRQDSRRSPTPR
jgi:hypothetical protein